MTDKAFNDKFNPLIGRIHRLEYLGYMMMGKGINEIGSFFLKDETSVFYLPVMIILLLMVGYVSFCGVAKRLRDIGLSGKWSFLIIGMVLLGQVLILAKADNNIVMLVGVIMILLPAIILLAIPPQKRDNAYGPYDPTSKFF